jgi:cell division protein ZipA
MRERMPADDIEPTFEREPALTQEEGAASLYAADDFDRTVVLEDIASEATSVESAEWPEVKLHEPTIAAEIRSEPSAPELRAAVPEPPVLTADAGRSLRPRASRDSSMTDNAKAAPQRKILALRLAVKGEGLAGAELLELLQGAGLRHGKFGIFHRLYGDTSVFSVASMVEPGTFDLSTMEQTRFPGLTLFMLLPGPIEGPEAFAQMLSFAQRLAEASDGTLQDERGRPLTLHTVDQLRDEVLDFQHLHGGTESSRS